MIPSYASSVNSYYSQTASTVPISRTKSPVAADASALGGNSMANLMGGGTSSFDLQASTPAQAIYKVLQFFSYLLSAIIQGQNAGAQTGSNPGQDTTGSLLTPQGQPGTTQTLPNTTADPTQKQRLDDALSRISQDPEGAKLIAAARAKGYTVEVGDPGQAGGAAGVAPGSEISGVTLSDPGNKKIIINPNAPDFGKTLAHELVHAATDGDGDSQQEEGIADVIGYQIANRVFGTPIPSSIQQIYQSKMASYPSLANANSIRQTLASLGIDPGV